jgi:hypothetical protein
MSVASSSRDRDAGGAESGELERKVDARRLIRRIDGVRTAELRRSAVAFFVADVGPDGAVAAFEELLWMSLRGESKARDSWASVAQWLISRSVLTDDPLLASLREAAGAGGFDGLSVLLRPGRARKVLPDAALRRESATRDAGAVLFPMSAADEVRWALTDKGGTTMFELDSERARAPWCSGARVNTLTFGELYRIVRFLRVADRIDNRMLMNATMSRFLGQRWLELRDLLVLLTRRPQDGRIARASIMSDRWGLHPKVHVALVTNPYSPSEIVLPLLPILPHKTLRWLAAEERGPSVVSDAARRLTGQAALSDR